MYIHTEIVFLIEQSCVIWNNAWLSRIKINFKLTCCISVLVVGKFTTQLRKCYKASTLKADSLFITKSVNFH